MSGTSTHVVLTGAGGGLGRVILEEVLNRPEVSRVTAFSSRPADYIQSLNFSKTQQALKKLVWVQCDFSNREENFQALLPADGPHECPLVLIHNAGTLAKNVPGQWMESSARTMWEVNFWSALRLTYLLLPAMAPGSHIVNIGSMGGFQGSVKFPGLALYSASKAALACWTECLAAELADRRIHVNCLALGSADTDMLRHAFPGYTAPVTAERMGRFVADFALYSGQLFNGKVIPVAMTTP